MPIYSNPMLIKVVIAIGVTFLWVCTSWIAYICGHRHGYTDCLNKMRTKRRSRRKTIRDDNIHVLNPVEPRKHYAEAESVRIIATHTPRFEEEDIWL